MAGGCAWSRRVAARTRTLRVLVRDTQRALQDVCDILHFDPDVLITVQEIGNQSVLSTALVVLGTTASARARLLHCLLGRQLLPDPPPRGCKWLRIQYGSSTQVHLTLGNSEFELVEELECNKRSWETLPAEDLIRHSNADLTTILEVEVNNQFLKDGLQIIVPPDIDTDPGTTDHITLKKIHSELYTKRECILRNFNPVYLYAIDRMGKNIFSDNIINTFESSRNDENLSAAFNLYGVSCGADEFNGKREVLVDKEWKESQEPSVFTGENCLDLDQLKDLNPKSQPMFVLFSDSVNMGSAEDEGGPAGSDATESVESTVTVCCNDLPESDQEMMGLGPHRCTLERSEALHHHDRQRLHEVQTAFMNELLDQWELMSNQPQKNYVRSQWMIVDDVELLRTVEQRCVTGFVRNASETCAKSKDGDRRVRSRTVLANVVVKFAADCLHSYLLEYCTKLSEVHVKLLQQFILSSFDMARELQVVPKKIQYVARQEQHLFEAINEKFSKGDKKQELVKIMRALLNEMRSEVICMDWSVDDLPCHQDRRFAVSSSVFYSTSVSPDLGSVRMTGREFPCPAGHLDASDGEEAVYYDTCHLDDYEIISSNEESLGVCESYGPVGNQQTGESILSRYKEIRVETESDTFSASESAWGRSDVTSTTATATTSATSATTCTTTLNISVKQASLDVQQTVLSKLSRKISLKLVKFIDCLKETYFGTLQRCLESLEVSCREELGGRPASEAMRQLTSVAWQVDLQPCASFSVLRTLLDSLRRLLSKLRIAGSEAEEACCLLSPIWRRQVAVQTVQSLSAHRLARIISAQILERVNAAHGRYQSALGALQGALAGRLRHTEESRLALRKRHAPALARLCLEATSVCDLLLHGTPDLGREIGRGQYGVVYSVRGSWGGLAPAAVKSVLPADERHYQELAMEFFYTRSIPAHPRIVPLYGSIVQRHAGSGPCVLLVSERKCRDLHAAVRAGLSFAARMRISCDIVEGIRYLHSLGLVHRDIKMKNVLLDANGRAALSDLGFCAAEALMSGSVVGTPVHMAPELLDGDYDAAVDVYAFGILFWYVCAGNIKLPTAFEMFQNKEQLWNKVKKGLRPERLPQFTDECWEVMQSCWAPEPSQRALLGDVHPKLEAILERALQDQESEHSTARTSSGCDLSDDDSLDMTGIGKNLL